MVIITFAAIHAACRYACCAKGTRPPFASRSNRGTKPDPHPHAPRVEPRAMHVVITHTKERDAHSSVRLPVVPPVWRVPQRRRPPRAYDMHGLLMVRVQARQLVLRTEIDYKNA